MYIEQNAKIEVKTVDGKRVALPARWFYQRMHSDGCQYWDWRNGEPLSLVAAGEVELISAQTNYSPAVGTNLVVHLDPAADYGCFPNTAIAGSAVKKGTPLHGLHGMYVVQGIAKATVAAYRTNATTVDTVFVWGCNDERTRDRAVGRHPATRP